MRENARFSFQKMIDSLRFTAPLAQATQATPEAGATPIAAIRETATPAPTSTSAPVGSPTPVVHVVESGDTLLGIAVQYDVTVEDLEAANGIDDPTKLRIGQELVIPIGGYTPSGAGAVTATITLSPTVTETVVTRVTRGATVTPTQTLTATAEETQVAATVEATRGAATPQPPPGTAAAGATAAATPEPTATSAPRPTPTPAEVALSGKIVYPVYSAERMLQGQPGSYDVYMSDPQGTNHQLLAYNGSQPSLNSGGDLLAYKSWESTGRASRPECSTSWKASPA